MIVSGFSVYHVILSNCPREKPILWLRYASNGGSLHRSALEVFGSLSPLLIANQMSLWMHSLAQGSLPLFIHQTCVYSIHCKLAVQLLVINTPFAHHDGILSAAA